MNNIKKQAEQLGFDYEKKGRRLVWYDNFDKAELDFDKWCFRRTMNGDDRIYDNGKKHIRTENGKLLLQVHRTGDPEKPWSLPEGICTAETMLFKYGYVEMRAKLPFGHGAWPSFWTQSKTAFGSVPWFGEIDILEAFSSENKVVANIHKWGDSNHTSLDDVELGRGREYRFKNAEKLCDEYHTYGLEWDTDKLRFYVDDEMFADFPIGDESCEIPNHVLKGAQCFHDPHFLIINNELFTPKGSYVKAEYSVTTADKLPFSYYIDSVCLYQKDGEIIYLKNEIAAKNK